MAEFTYTVVRRETRQKTVSLVVDPDDSITVVVPERVRDREIAEFVSAKSSWIRKKLEQNEKLRTLRPVRPLAAGTKILFRGQEYLLSVSHGKRAGARLVNDRLEVTLGGGAVAVEDALRSALKAWYIEQGRIAFPERVGFFAQAIGVHPGPVSVRWMRSRWGSCSNSGRLSLNGRLMLAPPAVLDYVIVHELCHLVELNHSPAFWRLVSDAMPGFRVHRHWLREHGSALLI